MTARQFVGFGVLATNNNTPIKSGLLDKKILSVWFIYEDDDDDLTYGLAVICILLLVWFGGVMLL